MILRRSLFASAAALVLYAGLHAAAPSTKAGLDTARLALIPQAMKAFVDRGELAGAVTLVARHGQVAELDAVGWQDMEARKPMRTDSIFQIMSMTKPFTGVGIMMLAEEGKLTLYDPVELHVPAFKDVRMYDGTRPRRPIAIRDLMTHTSGMSGRLPPDMEDFYSKMDRPLSEAVTEYAKQPLEFEPGSKWQYSNSGLATLGRIIEVVSGQPYEKFIEDRILRPLGMKDSFYFVPQEKSDRIAMVYAMKDGKLSRCDASILGGDPAKYRRGAKYSGPEFALFSTASDLAMFYQMMLNGGTYNGRRYLSPASVEAMTRVQTGDLITGHNPGSGFGLTWEIVKEPVGTLALLSQGTFKHGGAFGTHGWVDTKKDIVGVFLIQRDDDDKRARDAFMQIVGSAVVD